MSRHILKSQLIKIMQIRNTEKVLCKKTLRTFIKALDDKRYYIKIIY
jgi:hypothetical protein